VNDVRRVTHFELVGSMTPSKPSHDSLGEGVIQHEVGDQSSFPNDKFTAAEVVHP
jgi:hypothetical protein